MLLLSKYGKELPEGYKTWLCKNPSKVQNLEKFANIGLFIAAGKFSNTVFAREVAAGLSKLFHYMNCQLVHSSDTPSNASKLKILIGILERVELLLEKAAEDLGGEKARWTTIVCLQILKCIGKGTLVLHYKEKVLYDLCAGDGVSPPQSTHNDENVADGWVDGSFNEGFILKRSGRVVRKVNSAPVKHRHWKPPIITHVQMPCIGTSNNDQLMQLIGELVYIFKPIVHLCVMMKFGYRSWKSWSTSLAMELVSLYLLNYKADRRGPSVGYTPLERNEISKRRLLLILYVIKSPCYEKYSRNFLQMLSLVPHIGDSLWRYIDFRLSSYYFHWSS